MKGKPFDLVSSTKLLKSDKYSFNLSTKRWRQFKSTFTLSWSRIAFTTANKAKIPKARGIYAFTLELSNHGLPTHGYILYVGITGDGSDRTLRSRYAEYLAEPSKRRGRRKIVYMLTEWQDDLIFNYAPISDKRISLRKIERSFLNAVIPPINSADFSAEILSANAAAF